MKITRNEPVRTKKTYAFVEDGFPGLKLVDVDVFKPSPKGRHLRTMRLAAGVSLGDAAREAGIKTHEWCGLELGSHDTDDWDTAFNIVNK